MYNHLVWLIPYFQDVTLSGLRGRDVICRLIVTHPGKGRWQSLKGQKGTFGLVPVP